MSDLLVASVILLWILVLLNLVLTLAIIRRLNVSPRGEDGLKTGTVAPNFTATTVEGAPVSLSTYAGRTVAFLFISPTCGPCREALPRYAALYSKAQRSGVVLVLVSDADGTQTQALVDEFQIEMPVLVAPRESNSLIKDYKIEGTPAYCVVDPDGRVRSSGYPSFEWGDWKKLADAWATSYV